MTHIKTLFAALVLTAGLGQAHATLLEGQKVGFSYYYPDTGTPADYADNGVVTVGNGVEIANVTSYFWLFPIAQLDISDNNLLITFPAIPAEYAPYFISPTDSFSVVPFNGFAIYDATGLINAFTAVTLNPLSNMIGFDDSRITFDDDHIWINWQGLTYTSGSTVLSIDIKGENQAIPEPSTVALLGLGMLLITMAGRRKA